MIKIKKIKSNKNRFCSVKLSSAEAKDQLRFPVLLVFPPLFPVSSLPPSASVKPPLFQPVPQQRAIIDGTSALTANPNGGLYVCCRNTNLFLPQTCNWNSQTGQRRGSRKPKLKKDSVGGKLNCEPISSWSEWG